ALQWLADVLHVRQALCLVRPADDSRLVLVASHGLPPTLTSAFSVSLDDWGNPLVTVWGNRRAAYYPPPHSIADRRRRPVTPFEDAGIHVIPLGGPASSDDAFGLLLLTSAAHLVEDHRWLVSALSQKLAQILRQTQLSEGDRRLGRERSLLH